MKIRTRISLALGLTLIAAATGIYFAVTQPMSASFEKLEHSRARNDASRVERALGEQITQLHIKSADWANWDDTYAFVKDRNQAYIESNLSGTTCADLKIDAISILDLARRDIYTISSPGGNATPSLLASNLVAQLEAAKQFDSKVASTVGVSGVILCFGKPVAVTMRPIRDTNQKMSSRGWIIFAKYIDDDVVADLRRVTQQDVSILPGTSKFVGGKSAESGFESARVILSPASTSILRTYTKINDLEGKPALILQTNLDRHVMMIGESAVHTVHMHLLLIGLLFASVVLVVVDRVATSRMARLSREVASITDFSSGMVVSVQGKDEVTALATSVNKMLGSLHRGAEILKANEERIRSYSENLEETVQERTQQIEHQAFHDKLTGLPNRALFIDRLDIALSKQLRSGNGTAAIFVDLDGFKLVNDSLGHDMGDQLLVTVGERLTAAIRPGDTVSRFGGDEFAILLEELVSIEEAVAVADRVLAMLRDPVVLGSHETGASASIGIAFKAGTHSISGAELLKQADLAMYRVKAAGKSNYAVYDDSMQNHAIERLELETDLRKALANGEMRVHYQPLIDLQLNCRVGAEALARWYHPTRGMVFPDDFIQIAEDTGLIISIGYWILEESCRQTKEWIDEFGDQDFTISVNVSGKQLQRDDVVERVQAILQKTGLPAPNLKIEITETVLMTDRDVVAKKLNALKELGVRLALDDFGTGYSSLATLRAFPIDTLKIDRAFISRLGDTEDALPIVKAILGLAETMQMDVTGEGVENSHQAETIRDLGCHTGQGYLFEKPLSAKNFRDRFMATVFKRAA